MYQVTYDQKLPRGESRLFEEGQRRKGTLPDVCYGASAARLVHAYYQRRNEAVCCVLRRCCMQGKGAKGMLCVLEWVFSFPCLQIRSGCVFMSVSS